jgi:hypothetical protein
MSASLVLNLLRILTWGCVILLAVVSLLPGQALAAALSLLPAIKMVRSVLPAPLEHFVVYAGVAAIAVTGYGPSRDRVRISVPFASTPVSWSTSVTFRRVGIRQSGNLLARRLECCAAGSPWSCSGVASPLTRVEGSSVPCGLSAIGTMGNRHA